MSDAYNMGRDACLRGDDSGMNPFDDQDQQFYDWLDGWYDAA